MIITEQINIIMEFVQTTTKLFLLLHLSLHLYSELTQGWDLSINWYAICRVVKNRWVTVTRHFLPLTVTYYRCWTVTAVLLNKLCASVALYQLLMVDKKGMAWREVPGSRLFCCPAQQNMLSYRDRTHSHFKNIICRIISLLF